MAIRNKNRALAFEQLEVKATPSTLLLALAPLDDAFHVAAEQLRDQAAGEVASCLVADLSGNWQVSVSTRELLHFVESHTCSRDRDTAGIELPTPETCQRVDEMMKLEDGDARALIIAEQIAAE